MSKQIKISATDSLVMDITVALSRYYHGVKAENVKRGMLRQAANGYAMHRPPLGYSTTETAGLFKINSFGTVIREELKALASGSTTFQAVAAILTTAFDPFDPRPEAWSVAKVKRLAVDPYYAGYISHKGQLYAGLHEPLITIDDHQKLLFKNNQP